MKNMNTVRKNGNYTGTGFFWKQWYDIVFKNPTWLNLGLLSLRLAKESKGEQQLSEAPDRVTVHRMTL